MPSFNWHHILSHSLLTNLRPLADHSGLVLYPTRNRAFHVYEEKLEFAGLRSEPHIAPFLLILRFLTQISIS